MTATTTPDTDSESAESDSTDAVTTTFEVGDEVITCGPDTLDGRDETAVRFVHSQSLLWIVAEIVDGEEVDPDERDVEAMREFARVLEDALQAGHRVLDSAAYEAFLQNGPEALPEDVLEAVREDFVPVVEHFGVDLGIEAASEVSLADHLLVGPVGGGS